MFARLPSAASVPPNLQAKAYAKVEKDEFERLWAQGEAEVESQSQRTKDVETKVEKGLFESQYVFGGSCLWLILIGCVGRS